MYDGDDWSVTSVCKWHFASPDWAPLSNIQGKSLQWWRKFRSSINWSIGSRSRERAFPAPFKVVDVVVVVPIETRLMSRRMYQQLRERISHRQSSLLLYTVQIVCDGKLQVVRGFSLHWYAKSTHLYGCPSGLFGTSRRGNPRLASRRGTCLDDISKTTTMRSVSEIMGLCGFWMARLLTVAGCFMA